MKKLSLALFIACLIAACNNSAKPDAPSTNPGAADNTPPTLDFAIVKAYPHDTSAYTEGLLFHDGQLFESTGTEPEMPASRRSLFGTVNLANGKITPKVELDRNKYFGEGIVFLNGKVYQLTYTTKVGFVYDAKTFKKLGEFQIPSNEGWGMTTDGASLMMSDGTSNISYLDPSTFRLQKVLGVQDNNGPVSNLNELEMIKGYLYANVWQTNYVLKIDPASGKVVARLNLDNLVNQVKNQFAGSEVLNGIAYDSTAGKVYVTGKLWPSIFEIKFPL
jgi:glutamine cyclotransferase